MRPQDQIDHIRKFECGWCGSAPGEPCYQKSHWHFTGRLPMDDFHMARTRAAYPTDASSSTRDA